MKEQRFDVFLSHNNKDKEIVHELALHLHDESDIASWLDAWQIPTGSDWEKVIQDALDTCNVFAVFLGEHGWSKYHLKETLVAIERQRRDSNYRIVPVLLPGSKDTDFEVSDELIAYLKNLLPGTEIPTLSEAIELFRSRQRVDFRVRDGLDDDEAFQRLVTGIRGEVPYPEGKVNASAIRRDARQWLEGGKKDKTILYRGTKLREAQTIAEAFPHRMNEAALQFIEASGITEQRNKRLLAMITIFAIIGLSLAAIFGGQVGFAQRNATKQVATARAEQTARVQAEQFARSRELAAQSIDQISVNRELALLLAIEAGRQAETFEADTALRRSMNDKGNYSRTLAICSGHTAPLHYVAWSPDRLYIATASSDGVAMIWNAVSCTEVAVLEGHHGPVWFVAWDPDGNRVVTTGDDGTARVWNARSGEQVSLFSHPVLFFLPSQPIGYAAWDPSGRYIVTASDDGIPRVWEAEDGAERLALRGHQGPVTQVAWSPDGKQIASTSEDGTARIWDSESGAIVAVLQEHVFGGKAFPVQIAKWSPDGTRFLTVGTEGSGIVWNSTTFKPNVKIAGTDRFGAMPAFIRFAEWNKAGTRIVVTKQSPENRAEVWDAETGSPLPVLLGHTNSVEYADWSDDDTRIVTASLDRTIRVWDAETGEQLDILTGHTGEIFQAVWSPSGKFIASASNDHTARVWGLDPTTYPKVAALRELGMVFGSGTVRAAWQPEGKRIVITNNTENAFVWDIESEEVIASLVGAGANLKQPAWSPDGRFILITDTGGKVGLWHGETFDAIAVLDASEDTTEDGGVTVQHAGFSPDGKYVWAEYSAGSLHLWNMRAQGGTFEPLPVEVSGKWPIAWDSNSRLLATSDNESIPIWDLFTGEKSGECKGHTRGINDIAWGPAGGKLASARSDGTIRICDTNSGEDLFVLAGHDASVASVAWNPNGLEIASASSDHTARIWDAQTGQEIAKMSLHTDRVNKISWNLDGSRILTASSDNTARIWDGTSGNPLSVLSGHGDGLHFSGIVQALWSPMGNYVVTIGFDDRVLIHYVHVSNLIEAACQLTVREMSASEWREYMGNQPYRSSCLNLPVQEVPTPTPVPTINVTQTPEISSTMTSVSFPTATPDSAQPLELGSAQDAEQALAAGVSFLELKAFETPIIPEVIQPGDEYVYRASISESEPVIWSYGWCATTNEILNDNFHNMLLVFKVDNSVVSMEHFAKFDYQLSNLACRLYYTVIGKWTQGEHQLEVQVTFEEPIDDGQNVFPKGTHAIKYLVLVNE